MRFTVCGGRHAGRQGFDLWADSYDNTVREAEENDEYPFAGYHRLMNAVYGTVMERSPAKVLDVGIGTALLSQKLYRRGCEVTGIDFSEEMLQSAQRKMPDASLMLCDFLAGYSAVSLRSKPLISS